MGRDKFEEMYARYRNDALFCNLVNALTDLIDRLEMTPSEVREAALFAVIRHETLHAKAYAYIFKNKDGKVTP